MASLAGKVICITGGASGIGLQTARKLAGLGVKAICIGDFETKNFETITSELKQLGPSVAIMTIQVDVSSSDQIKSWMKLIVETFGALDGALNAAAVADAYLEGMEPPFILNATDESWKKVLDVNLTGVFYSNREEIRAMCQLPPSPRSIVNISSVASLIHARSISLPYGSTKCAVRYLSRSISKDVMPFGIRVNTVLPGFVRTPMAALVLNVPVSTLADMQEAHGYRFIDAEDVARTIVYLLSEDSGEVFGAELCVGDCGP